MDCKKCGEVEIYYKLSNKKIIRYGVYCSKCNRFLKWLPKKEEATIDKNLIRKDLF